MKKIALKKPSKNNPIIQAYTDAVKKGLHVIPEKQNWTVKRSESDRATKFFDSKKDAILEAQKIARNQKTELFIHGRNGRIRERNSYSVNSCPAKR